ncbi:helix-turn-helix transcriptional regulator [Palaeococcus pacificus]|uniref:helix-turn-helix transcriptional regulator n=1 Tax=Palaeococcus pacificus TaxID=971279 RepID=UPI001F02FA7C|nr:MarR family transcriptional regulator [Palaeococcus pacificus]
MDESKIKETIEIDLTANTTLEQYIFYSDYSIENPDAIVEINGRTVIANVSINIITGNINAVYINFPTINKGDRVKIRISFYSSGVIQEVNGRKQFSYYIKFSQPVGYFYARLYMPKGYAVLTPIIPSPNKLESRENSLILEWSKKNLRSGEEFYFLVGFSQEIKEKFDLRILLILVLFAFVGGFYSGMLYKDRKAKERPEFLKSDEEKVIEILKEGPILQSELVKKLKVSKAKVSILLREMEEKGLIERVKDGRSYLVKLKEG